TQQEGTHWRAAAQRECTRYGLASDFVEARLDGRQSAGEAAPSHGLFDWFFVAAATAVFLYFAAIARVPNLPAHWTHAILLCTVPLILLAACGLRLWRTTRFQ